MTILNSLTLFSSVAFILYGVSCMITPTMKLEFIRFGLAPYRIATGILQLLGGLSLGFSWYFDTPLIASIAAGGLAFMMLLGFGVRLRIKDTVVQSAPAFLFFIVNIYLAYRYYELAYSI